MPSLETLDLISNISWKAYNLAATFQNKFWLNRPIHWDVKTRKASAIEIKKCIPLLIITLAQIPIYSYSFVIVYRQTNPKYADNRFPLKGTVITAFGSCMNVFLTFGSIANFYKRKEWALCLNVIAEGHFEKKTKLKPTSNSKAVPIWRKLKIDDIIAKGFFAFLMMLATSGFSMPLVMNADPLTYVFIDVPVGSREWKILKYGIRPILWGTWTCYSTWTFYIVTANIFFVILHGLTKIPKVPKNSKAQKLVVIQNSFANLSFGQRLAIQLQKAAYKEYREFQVFIRPANDAAYIVIPDGLAGIALVAVIGGFATIKAYHRFPINIYILFPSIFCMIMLIIGLMIPQACNVFESALAFKHYWLSRFVRKEVRKRIMSLRPMGIAAGPFGYVQKSLPMTMTDSIIDFICSLALSSSI